SSSRYCTRRNSEYRAPDPLAPGSAYGEAKRYCELLCSTSGVPFTVARLFACFGPRQALESGFAIPDFFRQLLINGRIEIAGDGEARRAFGYITDVVAALLKLLLRGDSGPQVCNVGADTPVVSIAELARLVAHIWGGADVLIRGNSGDALRPRYIPDISKMKALHPPQVGLEAGLRRVAESLRASHTMNSAVSRA
ncbi:MAG: NAD(P)-dependent oxidoreductase, partial [Proteobacteria bacterium]|nr:NAD(P)-dependent oxidoreductase [Pseudomonadota bacterium]